MAVNTYNIVRIMSEFSELWYKKYQVIIKAEAEAKEIAREVAMLIKEKYWNDIVNIAVKNNLEPVLGITYRGMLDYVPLLYLFTDKDIESPNEDEEFIRAMFKELKWIGKARLRVELANIRDKYYLMRNIEVV